MIRVFKWGNHSNRTPLSYLAFQNYFSGKIWIVNRPELADIYICAHIMDVQKAPFCLVEQWRKDQKPIVILSEEPFWDTIWGQKPLDPLIYVETRYGALPVHQINHQLGQIFDFRNVPYYLLTNHRFQRAYKTAFIANSAKSSSDWLQEWQERKLDVAFMFERRPEPYHWVEWQEANVIGLCSWRTDFAERCEGVAVQRFGKSWGGKTSRFELKLDWHADKLQKLNGISRMIGSLENTHCPNYITEKFFDAFCCGSLPIYYANPSHRISEFEVPSESWLNVAGLTPDEAVEKLKMLSFDRARAQAYAEAQYVLGEFASQDELWHEERKRVAQKTVSALEATFQTR